MTDRFNDGKRRLNLAEIGIGTIEDAKGLFDLFLLEDPSFEKIMLWREPARFARLQRIAVWNRGIGWETDPPGDPWTIEPNKD